jgi:hypothetical protein
MSLGWTGPGYNIHHMSFESSGQASSIFLIRGPNGETLKGVEVSNSLINGGVQEIGHIKWNRVAFTNVIIVYKDGPLSLTGVTFSNCEFVFLFPKTDPKFIPTAISLGLLKYAMAPSIPLVTVPDVPSAGY